ncbi:hypothetical protein D3C75_1152010 [compost metagenome]
MAAGFSQGVPLVKPALGAALHCMGVRELSRDLAPRMARISASAMPSACLMAKMLRLSTS